MLVVVLPLLVQYTYSIVLIVLEVLASMLLIVVTLVVVRVIIDK